MLFISGSKAHKATQTDRRTDRHTQTDRAMNRPTDRRKKHRGFTLRSEKIDNKELIMNNLTVSEHISHLSVCFRDYRLYMRLIINIGLSCTAMSMSMSIHLPHP